MVSPGQKQELSPRERGIKWYGIIWAIVFLGIIATNGYVHFKFDMVHKGWQKYFEVTNLHQENDGVYGEITNISSQKLYNVDIELLCTEKNGNKVSGYTSFELDRYIDGRLSSIPDYESTVDIDIGETFSFTHYSKKRYEKVVIRDITFDKKP